MMYTLATPRPTSETLSLHVVLPPNDLAYVRRWLRETKTVY